MIYLEFLYKRNYKVYCRNYFVPLNITVTMGGPPAWGLGDGLTTPHRKNQLMLHGASKFARSCGHGNEPSGSIKYVEILE